MIEIIRLQQFDQVFTDDCRYRCLVVTKDKSQREIVVVDKGNVHEVKHARTYRVMMKNKANDVQSYVNFWGPFEKELIGKKTIYVSLDGVYNQINLNTLKKTANDYLIRKYEFILLNIPRDIIVKNKNGKNGGDKKATIIGFPNYGANNIARLPAIKKEVEGIGGQLKTSGYQVAELM